MSGKNPFFTEDDEVDDDEFLRNSRPNGGGYGGHPDPIDERRQQLMQTRRQIEERTLDSSQRSLGLLYESEKVGVATADELSRQKDQLKNTEQRLDDINSTLKQSERHLNGIKSVFGGLRNYFSGKGAASTAAAGQFM
jgi:synaptosomal-associated protein 29